VILDLTTTMRNPCAVLLLIACGAAFGQSPVSVIGYRNTLPTPVPVAPGQLITLIVVNTDPALTQLVRAPGGANLPTTLAGISIGYLQLVSVAPGLIHVNLPIFEAYAFPTLADAIPLSLAFQLAAVTVQIPYEAGCELCYTAGVPAGGAASIGAGATAIDASALSDQVHMITTCDAFMATGISGTDTGLPCPSVVTHSDGSAVSVTSPAKAGEELVAYAVGLGQTNPASVTGQLVTNSAPTVTTFTLDYSFHPNALPSRPLPNGPQPIFAGTTPGYVGLYQVNFTVPLVPAGTPPCVDASSLPIGANVVQSNLTVSIGGQFSFDGARICVATN
jgi:uncharacterized protein (TIGR03437 family)